MLCKLYCLFIQFMRFSQHAYWGSLPFPSPVDHVLSELYTMTCLSWVAQHGMAHSFIKLCKPLHHGKAVTHEGEMVRDREAWHVAVHGIAESDMTWWLKNDNKSSTTKVLKGWFLDQQYQHPLEKFLRPHPRSAESETLGREWRVPRNLCFNKHPSDSQGCWHWRSTALKHVHLPA